MQVRIEQGVDIDKHYTTTTTKGGWFRKPKTSIELVYEQEVPAVLLYIELSEEEKAIVETYSLHESVIDETRFNETPQEKLLHKRELEDALRDTRESFTAIPGLVLSKEEMDEELTEVRRNHEDKLQPIKHTLADFLANPYIRRIKNAKDAADFMARLKSELLPKIKALLQSYSSPPSRSETFEL